MGRRTGTAVNGESGECTNTGLLDATHADVLSVMNGTQHVASIMDGRVPVPQTAHVEGVERKSTTWGRGSGAHRGPAPSPFGDE